MHGWLEEVELDFLNVLLMLQAIITIAPATCQDSLQDSIWLVLGPPGNQALQAVMTTGPWGLSSLDKME